MPLDRDTKTRQYVLLRGIPGGRSTRAILARRGGTSQDKPQGMTISPDQPSELASAPVDVCMRATRPSATSAHR